MVLIDFPLFGIIRGRGERNRGAGEVRRSPIRHPLIRIPKPYPLMRLISAFLLSPWGLILPLTGISLLLLATQLEKMTGRLAETYARRLSDCSDSEVDELVDAIVRLGDSGLPILVGGLHSERESVFFACRNALERNLDLWATQKETLRNEHYRQLTESLLKEVGEFKTTALTATAEFVDRILRETVRRQGSDTGNSAMVAANCERLFDRISTTRQRLFRPNDSSTAPTGDSIVRLHRSVVDPAMLAADEPLEGKGDLPHVDEFAVPRAELLYAYHQSTAFRQQTETPYRRPGNGSLPPEIVPESPLEAQHEMIASMGPVRQVPEAFALAQTQGKVANRFEPEQSAGNIAENYVADRSRPRPLNRNGEPFQTEPTPTDERENFLPEELKRVTPEKIPALPTTKLMRLLQHADDRIVAAARKTLVGRDGFQEAHLKLAFQLYHPLSAVRAELVGQLPNVGGIQQSVWLTELMNDPNADVRFLAASAIATTSDPSMQRLLADKGRRDADPRIVELAERMQEQRRKVRR